MEHALKVMGCNEFISRINFESSSKKTGQKGTEKCRELRLLGALGIIAKTQGINKRASKSFVNHQQKGTEKA